MIIRLSSLNTLAFGPTQKRVSGSTLDMIDRVLMKSGTADGKDILTVFKNVRLRPFGSTSKLKTGREKRAWYHSRERAPRSGQ